jgi:hypothetical protein
MFWMRPQQTSTGVFTVLRSSKFDNTQPASRTSVKEYIKLGVGIGIGLALLELPLIIAVPIALVIFCPWLLAGVFGLVFLCLMVCVSWVRVVDELHSALRQAGWIELRLEWYAIGSLHVTARIGARLKAKLGKSRVISAKEWLFGDFVRAARKAGLRPGIEDIGVAMNGRRIEGSASAVPMADSSVALDRMLERWLQKRRAKAASAEKATSGKGPGYQPARYQPRRGTTNFALH